MASSIGLFLFNAKGGLRTALAGVDYFRLYEYPSAVNRLDASKDHKVLDIGSDASLFPLFLAASTGCTVYATDISDSRLGQKELARELGLSRLLDEKVIVEVQDARALSYADSSFDRVVAVSTIEHIEGNGDTEAVREMSRVLKERGRMVISAPFSERYQENTKTPCADQFERRYDKNALLSRIVEASGLSLKSLEYFGERPFRVAHLWWRLPRPLRRYTGQMMVIPSRLFLGRVAEQKLHKACGAILVLEKNSI